MICLQPARLIFFRFGKIAPWHGTSKNIMRENGSLSESGKLLHDEVSADDKALQVHARTLVRACCVFYRREKKEDCARFRCIVDFYISLGNFTHNVGQWIVLNHAIVYVETVRGGICRYILLTLKF